FAARYTQIPSTVLYGDVRFRQESYDRSDEQNLAGDPFGNNFTRDTDSCLNTYQYRAGFNVSPWTRVALNAFYLHRDQKNNYNTAATLGGATLTGDYPGYIDAWNITTDEIGAKLTLRPATWLKTTFGYGLVNRDYEITTQPARFGAAPGGTIQAGEYDAEVFSVSATLNPFRRLFLFTSFSYSDTRTTTADNGDPAIVPYEGQIYSVLANATYALSEKTDVIISYVFSDGDYGQNNVTA